MTNKYIWGKLAIVRNNNKKKCQGSLMLILQFRQSLWIGGGGSNPRDETDEKIGWDVLYELFSLKELEEDG